LTAFGCAYFLDRARDPQAKPGIAAAPAAADSVAHKAVAGGEKTRSVTTYRTAMPLPLRGAPLKDTFFELQARADAGELAAAKRLYSDVRICSRLQGLDKWNARFADELLGEHVDVADRQQLEDYQIQLDAIEARKKVMQEFHGLCDGVTGAMLDSVVPDLQKAAQLGDEDARSCYLQRGPDYDARNLINHPEWLDTYRDGVASLVDSGMAAGDWKTVDILRDAYEPGSESPLAGVLGSDPYQYYRYLKLYRLGAEAYRADQIDQSLAAAAAQLSPAQLADADSWAQTAFQQNFNGSNSTESTVPGWDPCSFSYE
jgi:hypothetical protein